MAEQQRRLARLRVDANDRVLGLELHVAELVPVFLLLDVDAADLHPLGGVVEQVGVHRPEVADQRLERRVKAGVGGRGVRPDRSSAIRRGNQRAQHADRGHPVHERHVGVPGVGLLLLGVDRQDRHAVPADRRVRLHR